MNKPIQLGFDNWVSLKEDTHTYTDQNGDVYKSMTHVLNHIKPTFDAQKISYLKAKGSLGESASQTDILREQQRLLNEWDVKRETASDHGNHIHNNLERKVKTGSCDPDIELIWDKIVPQFGKYHRMFSEVILFNTELKFAGMTDLVLHRYSGRTTNVYDFYDYKTNLNRGIYFDSTSVKDGVIKHNNKFLYSPVEHLEDCNYNHYALQLSAYAYMSELRYGIKVGRLCIIFISPEHEVTMIPVNYMKLEIMAIFDYVKKLKPLKKPAKPVPSNTVENSYKKVSSGVDINNINTSW